MDKGAAFLSVDVGTLDRLSLVEVEDELDIGREGSLLVGLGLVVEGDALPVLTLVAAEVEHLERPTTTFFARLQFLDAQIK
jgi:hypothetical protein